MKNAQKLSAKIAEAFATSMESTREAAKDIGFHMTDWDSDVDELIALYEDPAAQQRPNRRYCDSVFGARAESRSGSEKTRRPRTNGRHLRGWDLDRRCRLT